MKHLLVLDDGQLAWLRWVLREIHHSRASYQEPLLGSRTLDQGGHCLPVLAQAEQHMLDHGVPVFRPTNMHRPLEGYALLEAREGESEAA